VVVSGSGEEPSERDWKGYALDWFIEWDWRHVVGSDLTPTAGERPGWEELTLTRRLRDAVLRLNPYLPETVVDLAMEQLLRRQSQYALAENFRVHGLITGGARVSHVDSSGVERHSTVRFLDFADPYQNEFVIADEVLVRSGRSRRRFDLVAYVNGLPVAVIELKKAGNEMATSETAYAQLCTYRDDLGVAGFNVPAIWVASDGVTARIGTPFTPWEHMAPWAVDEQGNPIVTDYGSELDDVPGANPQIALEVLISGVFEPGRLLDLMANFISFSAEAGGAVDTKKLAKAHQYFAVNKAIERTLAAVAFDGRAGVVWHTQGSGKSKEMEFYANKVLRHPALANPTVLILTDRLDLDEQLFLSFSASRLLPEDPIKVETRAELREELSARLTGGILFSTLQKFDITSDERHTRPRHPMLSDRRNIIVVVDEAHRSHYELKRGLARRLREALPNATFIAFTGTPLSLADRDTRAVFGDYIDKYDLTRAVRDGATVRVYYENQHVPVRLQGDVDPADLDDRAQDVTATLDPDERARAERAFGRLEPVVGAATRISEVAEHIVTHWNRRREEMIKTTGVPGKGMIVCLTRKICADLYAEIVKHLPDWHDDADDRGRIKVVYTGSAADGLPIRRHVRSPGQHKLLQRRAKNPDDELELVIVQSMWLTGFDSPPMHTLYLDKPMRGAALMQAVARVNRRFRTKAGGVIVDYYGVAAELADALEEYTDDDQIERPIGAELSRAVDLVIDQHAVICGILRGYEWRGALAAPRRTPYVNAVLGAANYLRDPVEAEHARQEKLESLGGRFTAAVRTLNRAFALCPADRRLVEYYDDIAFFDSVRICMAKFDAEERRIRGMPSTFDITLALRQLASSVILAGQAIDIYAAAGIDKPDLTNLDQGLVRRLQASPRPNLALEALRRLLEREIRSVHRANVLRQRTFSERLQDAMRRYTNNALTSAEIISELVALAREVTEDRDRARKMGLSEQELAFYDAVASNASAVRELGPSVLADIARDLIKAIRADVRVDWAVREQVQARLRSRVKRLLAKYGYPPDAEQQAVDLVLEQTKMFADELSRV
jgi:type I restriction enzyme R subunit